MDEFILIFTHADGNKVASPKQLQTWMKKAMDWIGSIAAQNKFVSGNGLPFYESRLLATIMSLQTAPLAIPKKPLVDILL